MSTARPSTPTSCSEANTLFTNKLIKFCASLINDEKIGVLTQERFYEIVGCEIKSLSIPVGDQSNTSNAWDYDLRTFFTSFDYSQDGNVFILGHSSYLPQIYNKNFQVFNGIQDLEWGDTIEVTTDTKVYVYRVDKVYKATADDATVIPIAGDDRRLTLATCNSFGKVEDRFIVEAVEISERPR